jgi:hypothetical protein
MVSCPGRERKKVLTRRFRVPLHEIAYIRMVVEAYDGLAVVVSPSAGRGIIEWWVAPGREAEADVLARALAGEAGLQPM